MINRSAIESFVKYNTYPIKEVILCEDSGIPEIVDFVKDILPYPTEIYYNKERIGQMKTIEKYIKLVKTPYVFHLEDDFEFFDYGFIELSFKILESDNAISQVLLEDEQHDFYKVDIGNPLCYKILTNDPRMTNSNTNYGDGALSVFSWRPSLKKLEISLLRIPYELWDDEYTIQLEINKLGKYAVITKNIKNGKKGFCTHIGKNDHVRNLNGNKKILGRADFPDKLHIRLKDINFTMNKYDNIVVPYNCKHVKLDIGLSYNASISNKWLIKESDVLVLGYEPVINNCNNILSINNGIPHHFLDFVLEKKFIEEKRFQLFNYALDNVNELKEGEIIVNKIDTGTSSLYSHNQTTLGPIDYKQPVQIISLKMIFDKFPWDRFEYIDYIKIDAQGSDLNILKSAGDYLKEKVVYVTAEPDGHYYIGAENNTEENITSYMESQNFERINHPFTVDPTYINKKFSNMKDEIFIHQCGRWPC